MVLHVNQVKSYIHWGDAYTRGITGRGVGVAVLDTGIYPHKDFDNRIIAFQDIVGRRSFPYDDNGHGTHISAIIGGSGAASDGKFQGMAPESHIISVKVLDSKGNGYASDVLAGLSWIRSHRQEYGIRIINISVGSFSRKGMTENSALVRGVNAAWDDGLVVVTAAGNLGPGSGTVTAPGSSRKVITVGSSDLLTGADGISGCGPTRDCVCKPDLVAPGKDIVSCAPGISRREYARKSGTSMSTPQISGAIALALQKAPYLTNVQIKMMLRDSVRDLGLPHNRQGWGEFDLDKFLANLYN